MLAAAKIARVTSRPACTRMAMHAALLCVLVPEVPHQLSTLQALQLAVSLPQLHSTAHKVGFSCMDKQMMVADVFKLKHAVML